MPNTLTNVHDIKVAQRALQPFTAALTPIRAFSTNFSPDPADICAAVCAADEPSSFRSEAVRAPIREFGP